MLQKSITVPAHGLPDVIRRIVFSALYRSAWIMLSLTLGFAMVAANVGVSRDGVVGAARVDALQRCERSVVVQVDDEPLALESGGTLVESEVDDGLDSSARPFDRDLAGEAKPGGSPRRTPRRGIARRAS